MIDKRVWPKKILKLSPFIKNSPILSGPLLDKGPKQFFNICGFKFELLLNRQRVKNSLQYKVILNPKHLYSDEDYNKIEYYSSLEYRFFEYLYRLDIDKLSETQKTNHENLQRLLDDVMKHDKSPASEELIQRKWNEFVC